MKSCARFFLAAALVITNSGPAAAQDSPLGDGAAVMTAERALVDAMLARDREALEQLLAPDYILRSSPDIDRATWLQNALTLCWGDRSDIDRFSARESGTTIVASFELTFYIDPGNCRPAVLRSLITDVWTRYPEGWRLTVRHAGPVPPPGAQVAGQFGLAPQLPPIWDISGELSFVATGGNTTTRTLGLGSDVVHRSGASTTRLAVTFLTSETDDVTRARSFATQGRHGIRVGARTELFGRGGYARDRFAGIENRTTADAGAALSLPLPRRHALTAEGSAGLTDERRLDGTNLRFGTATGALGYAWELRPGAELRQDIALVGDLQTGGNWRGTSTTAVTVTMTRLLSLKASHRIEYRNRAVTGFGSRDVRTAVALVFTHQQRPSGS